VYESLTTLQDKENGIETFRVLGRHIIVVLMNGTILFLNNDFKQETNPGPFNLAIPLYNGKERYTPLIALLKGNAYIATPRDLSFCEP
jgi:hypothetical protein